MSTDPQAIRAQEKELADVRAKLEETRHLLTETYKMASIGQLLAGIIHEINSPIGSLRSNNEVTRPSLDKLSQLLEGESTENLNLPKARKIVDTLRSLAQVDRLACDRISGVIRNLKTFARGDQMDIREVELREIIDAAVKLTQCEYRGKVRVVTHYGADVPKIHAYPEKLSQVFLNLLINAGQAIEGQGTVTIETRREGDFVCISVTDSGHGISAENLQRLFQIGFTTKPAGVGTGLGLAISKQIIAEKHGGAITVQSEPGSGTSFHIRLPIQGIGPSTGGSGG